MRPSGLPIVEEETAPVVIAVGEIEKRGRLNILPRWRMRVPWMNVPGELAALMVFSEPGLISIRCWEPDGPRIQERFAELAGSTDPDALDALRLIQDRYQRLAIPPRERPSLGDAALAHLGLPIRRVQKSTVYVAIFADRIELMSIAYRNTKLIEGHPSIDDLP